RHTRFSRDWSSDVCSSDLFVLLSLRLREPVRGRFERRAMGAGDDVARTEEDAPSWAESSRIVWQVRSLRRVYIALPFVAIAIAEIGSASCRERPAASAVAG